MLQDGLVKSNMEKLTFYASSQPEKLDRIGDYLVQKVSQNIYRNRLGFVEIAMEAMDILLSSCTPQTLNLFVESYLKIIQLLLETSDAQMQLLATHSVSVYVWCNRVLTLFHTYSSPNSLTFRKIPPHIIVDTIFLSQNSLHCRMTTAQIS